MNCFVHVYHWCTISFFLLSLSLYLSSLEDCSDLLVLDQNFLAQFVSLVNGNKSFSCYLVSLQERTTVFVLLYSSSIIFLFTRFFGPLLLQGLSRWRPHFNSGADLE